MISGIIKKFLYRYESSSYIIKNRARFILYLIFTLLILIPTLMLYHSYIHMHSPAYHYRIQTTIIGLEFITFMLTFFILIILIRGYFSIAGNLLLIITQSAIWGIMFFVQEDIITRIDTIVLVAATLTMMPIIVVSKKKLFLIYSLIDITLLFLFVFLRLDLSGTPFKDYLSDNLIAFTFIGIISYTIFNINSRALERAEDEIAGRKKAEDHRNRLQLQLLQSQKLESVGLLAGGIAHDFNNMLAAVQGFAELASDDIDPDSRVKEDINEIIKASQKARDLTQQLLAFARIQPLDLKNININDLIKDFTYMLSRTLRENIIIRNDLCENPGSIECDPIQIEQIILNLTLNSQDAMPRGGTIVIATTRVEIEDDFIKRYENFSPGPYILLAISDNGSGIEPDIIDKIFDPFFTTKNFGDGTGLGLSTVYGIIKQHRGMIDVYSEKGKGTVFKIYLPVKDDSIDDKIPPDIKLNQLRGNETILAVDDNPEVRNLLRTILKKNGYTVFIADNPETALAISSSYDGIINLLVTDIILPGMNGTELYNKIRITRPVISVIYISGYTANAIDHNGAIEEINFIQKPFSISDFIRKIREVLDLRRTY